MVELEKLIMTRFMSYRERQVVRLKNRGVVNISGPNRVGKSVISEAILWCFFGKTLRGLKHDAVVNRFVKKDCKVEVLFRVQKVQRSAKRYRKHHKSGNSLVLCRDSKPLKFHHDSDTQVALERVLGCDFNSFVNSTVFGGFDGARKQFALFTDAEQKRLLDSFLRFERYDSARERAQQRRAEFEESLQKLEIQKSDLQGSLAPLRELVAFNRSNVEEQQKKKRLAISILRKKLKKLPVLEDVSAKLEKAERSLERRTIRLGGLDGEAKQYRQKLQELQQTLNRREASIGQRCSGCGQKIKASSVKEFRSHLAADRQQLSKVLSGLEESTVAIRKEVAYGRKALKRLQHKQTLRLGIMVRRGEFEERLSELRAEVITPFSINLSRLRIQYSQTLSKIIVLEQEKQNLQKQISDYRFWEVGFGNQGIKSLIIQDVLPTLNRQLRRYCGEIYDDSTEIQFSASKKIKSGDERDSLHLEYKSPSGANSYLGESSGGRRRCDLCVLLVFSWLAQASNVLFVDEFFDSLDADGRERALGILSKQRGSVFVISHERGVSSQLHRVWRVIKENKNSRLVTQP